MGKLVFLSLKIFRNPLFADRRILGAIQTFSVPPDGAQRRVHRSIVASIVKFARQRLAIVNGRRIKTKFRTVIIDAGQGQTVIASIRI
jgi:hypothetical protein